jgi:hypothetical protein
MAARVSSMLGSYYNLTGPAPAELREAFLSERSSGSAVQQVVDRAVERGEVDRARLTPRIIDLPFDLFRNEMLMTLRPVPDRVLRQIVDDIFIPRPATVGWLTRRRPRELGLGWAHGPRVALGVDDSQAPEVGLRALGEQRVRLHRLADRHEHIALVQRHRLNERTGS